MNIADLYRRLKQILNYSNEALIGKSLNSTNSLTEVFSEIDGKVNRLPYLVDRSVAKVSENDFCNITNIDDFAFASCHRLTSVTIPDSVTTIGDYAFSGCKSLKSVTIPDSVTDINHAIFYNCNNIVDITIPFIGFSRLANEDYRAVFGYLFGYTTDKSRPGTVFQESSPSSSGIGSCYYYIPSTIRSVTITDAEIIPYGAFHNCENITNITMFDGITEIKYDAFRNCKGLTSITIPDSVTIIGGYAFYNCTSLASATIGNSVTEIRSHAFAYCNSLTSVTIPDSVTTIGEEAFYGCINLDDMYIRSKIPPQLGKYGTIYPLTTIHVPVGSGNAYKSATNWSAYSSKIVEDIVIE